MFLNLGTLDWEFSSQTTRPLIVKEEQLVLYIIFWTINCFYHHQLIHKLQPGVFSQASIIASCQLEYFLWL